MKYSVVKITPSRLFSTDRYYASREGHKMHHLAEYDKTEIRECLSPTTCIDHHLADRATVTGVVALLNQRIEGNYYS